MAKHTSMKILAIHGQLRASQQQGFTGRRQLKAASRTICRRLDKLACDDFDAADLEIPVERPDAAPPPRSLRVGLGPLVAERRTRRSSASTQS